MGFLVYICGVFRAEWSQCLSYPNRPESVFCFHPYHRIAKIKQEDGDNETLMCWYISMACFHAADEYTRQREVLCFFSFLQGVWRYHWQMNQEQGSRFFCTLTFHAISESVIALYNVSINRLGNINKKRHYYLLYFPRPRLYSFLILKRF